MMSSEILPASLTFIGSSAGNGSQTSSFCSSASVSGAVTFEVLAPCAFRFNGFVEGYDSGVASTFFSDANGVRLGGEFGILEGVHPFDDAGFILPGTYSVDVNGNGGLCVTHASINFNSSLELTPYTRDYCTSTPNSSGVAASIGVAGSPSVAANDFVIQGSGGLPGQFGLFLYGETQSSVPIGNGTLCLGTPFIRLGDVAMITAAGTSEFALDFTAPALSVGAGAIQAGATWNFQWIFRDTVGIGLDLSHGVSVTFFP